MTLITLPTVTLQQVTAQVAAARPLIVNRVPAPGEVQVPLGAAVALEVMDPGPDGVDKGATKVWVDAQLAFDGSGAPEIAPAFAGLGAQVIHSGPVLRVVLQPLLPLVSKAEVVVEVHSATVGGQHLLDESYTFVAEDKSAPKLVAARALAPRLLELSFDEDCVLGEAFSCELSPQTSPAVTPTVIEAAADGHLVHLRLDIALTPHALYQASVAGVHDSFGNHVAPPHHTAVLSGYAPPRPARRRFDLWSMMPGYNRRRDQGGELRRLMACLQEVTDLLLADIDAMATTSDVERMSPAALTALLDDLGNPFRWPMTQLQQRKLAASLVELSQMFGTAVGVERAIELLMGLGAKVVPFIATTMQLGESELGVDWELGPSGRFERYAFNVEVERVLTGQERRRLRQVVQVSKSVRSHFVDIVEPTPPPTLDHWELGESELGDTATLH